MGRRERWLTWLVGCVALPIAMLVLAGPTLFTRPFWEDEVFSFLIASDRSFDHSMAALAGGVDTNAPLLHLLLRAVGSIFGHTPTTYRATALAGMATAVVGLYFTLRRTLEKWPAFVGCLFFCALPLVMTHATEARFYSWLTAAAIWTSLFVARRREKQGIASAALLAFSSASLCGIHYFGVLALVCIVIADALTDGRGIRRSAWIDRAARITPTLAGPAMTISLWPLLRTQRESVVGVGTWIVDDFAYNVRMTFTELLPPAAVLMLVGAMCIGLFGRRERFFIRCRETFQSPLAGFWLYAIALLAFDRFVQPVLVGRYFILVLPALAAVIASVAANFDRRSLAAATAGFAAFASVQLLQVRAALASPSPRSAMAIVASATASGNTPIVTDGLAFALPILARPDLRDRLLYVPPPRFDEPALSQAIAYERQMGRMVALFYDLPMRDTIADAERLDRFVLLTAFPESVHERFAAYERRDRGQTAIELQRRDGSEARSANAD